MLNFKNLNVLFLVALTQATACSAGQDAPPPASTTAPTSEVCPQVGELFKTAATDNVYQESPDSFIKSVGHFLKVAKDEISELAPGLAMRHITFTPTSPWLESGEMNYQVSSEGTEFDYAHFNLSSNCFENDRALLQLAAKSLGDSFSDYEFGSPDNAVERTWKRPEPDINYVRYFSLTTGEDPIVFKLERDPAPEENGDEEG